MRQYNSMMFFEKEKIFVYCNILVQIYKTLLHILNAGCLSRQLISLKLIQQFKVFLLEKIYIIILSLNNF